MARAGCCLTLGHYSHCMPFGVVWHGNPAQPHGLLEVRAAGGSTLDEKAPTGWTLLTGNIELPVDFHYWVGPWATSGWTTDHGHRAAKGQIPLIREIEIPIYRHCWPMVECFWSSGTSSHQGHPSTELRPGKLGKLLCPLPWTFQCCLAVMTSIFVGLSYNASRGGGRESRGFRLRWTLALRLFSYVTSLISSVSSP